MTTENHASDDQLMSLLLADEHSGEFIEASTHVEHCPWCQARLDQIAGDRSIAAQTRELLSEYPWNELSTCRELSKSITDVDVSLRDLDFLDAPSHPEMLGRIGRYEIERVVGAGGMGVVLKGFDTELHRPVAVKVLARQLSGSGAARKRFARESRAAAAVVHEHIVAIHNVEAERDVPYLVMQFVAGESLQARVDREGTLDARQVLRIGIQIASGLAAAHKQGVVHRDIKPSNILLENGVERVLITDFGLARTVDDASLTRTGVVAGTPQYMSPEQANGDVADHRSDLFSLGSLIYFMASGHPPFRADRAMGVLNRICRHRHKPLWQVADDIPNQLSVLVDRLLEKQPAKRFRSADEVHERLANLLATVHQPKSSLAHRFKDHVDRHPKQLTVAATLLGLLVLFGIVAAVLPLALEHRPAESHPQHVSDRAVADDETADAGNAHAAPVLDVTEASDFTATIDRLNSRLDALSELETLSLPQRGEPTEPDRLQTLHERLERLQQDNRHESHPIEEGKQ